MAPIRRELEAHERVNDSRQSAGSFSELVLEEYDKMNIDPLLGNKKGRLGSASPPKHKSPAARSDGKRDSPRSLPRNPDELVYPYKPPTERHQNLLEIEDSIYKDSKNMSLDLHHSNANQEEAPQPKWGRQQQHQPNAAQPANKSYGEEQQSIDKINFDIHQSNQRPKNKDQLIRLNQDDFQKPIINQFYTEQ